ncbi:MAG: hypothetical protein HXY40_03285 [Chloroflexi bacterium]|nr:hypothetical protein [Chloroflexota bacterium]
MTSTLSIYRALNAVLPAGHLVDTEQSLQIREYHPDTGERLRRPKPDSTLYSTLQLNCCRRPTSLPVTAAGSTSKNAVPRRAFESYSADDQARIRAVMARAAAAHAQ